MGDDEAPERHVPRALGTGALGALPALRAVREVQPAERAERGQPARVPRRGRPRGAHDRGEPAGRRQCRQPALEHRRPARPDRHLQHRPERRRQRDRRAGRRPVRHRLAHRADHGEAEFRFRVGEGVLPVRRQRLERHRRERRGQRPGEGDRRERAAAGVPPVRRDQRRGAEHPLRERAGPERVLGARPQRHRNQGHLGAGAPGRRRASDP